MCQGIHIVREHKTALGLVAARHHQITGKPLATCLTSIPMDKGSDKAAAEELVEDVA